MHSVVFGAMFTYLQMSNKTLIIFQHFLNIQLTIPHPYILKMFHRFFDKPKIRKVPLNIM